MFLVSKFCWVSVINQQFKMSSAIYTYNKKIHMKCPAVAHLKVCVFVRVVLCLFVGSRVMATIWALIRSHSSVLSHLSLSLEDGFISNHNGWQRYLNNESKLRRVSQQSRDISRLTGAAFDSSRSETHTNTEINKPVHTRTGCFISLQKSGLFLQGSGCT